MIGNPKVQVVNTLLDTKKYKDYQTPSVLVMKDKT